MTHTDSNIDRWVLRVAGGMVLLSLILSQLHSGYWLWLTAFVGANLLQSSFSGFCPLAVILQRLGVQPGLGPGLPDQLDVLGRDACQELGQVVGVAAVGRDEGARHQRRVDGPSRPGLEAQAPAGQDHLPTRVVPGEDDVVVEDAQDLHVSG